MCYTRELVCVECNTSNKRYEPKKCRKGTCPTDQIKVYLKYNMCSGCKQLSDLKPTLTATTEDFKLSVVFNRKPRTTKGLVGSAERSRRHKHRSLMSDEQVSMLVSVFSFADAVAVTQLDRRVSGIVRHNKLEAQCQCDNA